MSGRARAILGGLVVGGDSPVRIVGVVNVGPGSFYTGSVVRSGSTLRRRVRALVAAGADVIDVGARSTAPYLADQTSEDEEAASLGAAIATIRKVVDVPISADTALPGPLAAAIRCGATVANDVSGLANPECGRLVAEHGLGLIVMAHPGDRPFPADPVATVVDRLRQALERARTAGIPEQNIVIDPGIGFFRPSGLPWYEWDRAVLRNLGSLDALGRPVLVGLSRKSFIGRVLDKPNPADRLAGSLAAAVMAVLSGASAIRTHDVGPTRDAVRLAEWLRPAASGPA